MERARPWIAASNEVKSRDRTAQEWDGGEWVDVGSDGRWRPSPTERLRAVVVILVAIGILGALAAVVAGGDRPEDDDDVVTDTTTSETSTTTAPSTTDAPDPASVAGEPPPEQCAADDRGAAPLRAPGEVAVRVLNGTPRGGHAGSVSDDIEDAGYRTLEPGNADLLAVTRIDFQAGFCAEAVQLVEVLGNPGAEVVLVEPGSPLALETPPTDLTVTLGRDSL